MSDLAGLANGADLTGVLPEGSTREARRRFPPCNSPSIPDQTRTGLHRFRLQGPRQAPGKDSSKLPAEKSWRIIDRVAVDDIFLDLEVTDPTDSENREITCKVGGKLHLGSQAVIRPSRSFRASTYRVAGERSGESHVRLWARFSRAISRCRPECPISRSRNST